MAFDSWGKKKKRINFFETPNSNLFGLPMDLMEKGLIMLRSAVPIAGVIGLAAISHRLLRRYLTSSKSQAPEPQSQYKNQNKAGYTEQERTVAWVQSGMDNSNAFDALEWRKPVLGNVMEALTDPNTHLIGVYGLHGEIKDTLLQRVYRRVQRDQLFGMVVKATVTKYPDVRKIQEDIASQLGLTFNHVPKDRRSQELIHRIKSEQNILIVLGDLYKKLDLSKVGIPYGASHVGCKILLTSISEHVLSEHMHTQKNFMV